MLRAAHMDFTEWGKCRDCLVGTPVLIVPLRNESKKCYKLTLDVLHISNIFYIALENKKNE